MHVRRRPAEYIYRDESLARALSIFCCPAPKSRGWEETDDVMRAACTAVGMLLATSQVRHCRPFWPFFLRALALALPLIVPRLDCLERVGFAHAQLRRRERSWVRPAGVWIRPAAGHHWRPLPSRRGHDWIIFFGPTTACCAERLGSPCTHRTLAAGPARIAGGQDQLPIPAKRALRSVRAVPCGRSALFHPQITRQCHFVDEHGPVCRRQVRQPHALPVQPASGAPWH